MNPNQNTARLAGGLYLTYIIATIFANASRTQLIDFENTTATVSNLLSSDGLFRIGFVSDVLAGILFLLTAWALYVLLKPVNKQIALLFLLLNLGGVAVQCTNMLNLFSATLLLNNAAYLKAIPAEQLQALVMLFLNLHDNGFMIAQFFFGLWLSHLAMWFLNRAIFPKFWALY